MQKLTQNNFLLFPITIQTSWGCVCHSQHAAAQTAPGTAVLSPPERGEAQGVQVGMRLWGGGPEAASHFSSCTFALNIRSPLTSEKLGDVVFGWVAWLD